MTDRQAAIKEADAARVHTTNAEAILKAVADRQFNPPLGPNEALSVIHNLVAAQALLTNAVLTLASD